MRVAYVTTYVLTVYRGAPLLLATSRTQHTVVVEGCQNKCTVVYTIILVDHNVLFLTLKSENMVFCSLIAAN